MNELNCDAEPQNVQSKSRYAFVFFQIKRKDIFTLYTINKIASLRSAFLTVFFIISHKTKTWPYILNTNKG